MDFGEHLGPKPFLDCFQKMNISCSETFTKSAFSQNGALGQTILLDRFVPDLHEHLCKRNVLGIGVGPDWFGNIPDWLITNYFLTRRYPSDLFTGWQLFYLINVPKKPNVPNLWGSVGVPNGFGVRNSFQTPWCQAVDLASPHWPSHTGNKYRVPESFTRQDLWFECGSGLHSCQISLNCVKSHLYQPCILTCAWHVRARPMDQYMGHGIYRVHSGNKNTKRWNQCPTGNVQRTQPPTDGTMPRQCPRLQSAMTKLWVILVTPDHGPGLISGLNFLHIFLPGLQQDVRIQISGSRMPLPSRSTAGRMRSLRSSSTAGSTCPCTSRHSV